MPGEDTARAVAAMLLIGGGLIVALGLLFYAVGRSEDRDREAERKRRPRPR
ncbi:MAG TPA: hypothetical protein VFR97_14750 [Capillimicrobium sp.]|nr:hypothetical protein [Capillimicrobium sp.]